MERALPSDVGGVSTETIVPTTGALVTLVVRVCRGTFGVLFRGFVSGLGRVL